MSDDIIPVGPEPAYERVVSGYETLHLPKSFRCEWGSVLPELNIAYETWGELSERRDNVVLLHTGLSASSHAKSQPHNRHKLDCENLLQLPSSRLTKT